MAIKRWLLPQHEDMDAERLSEETGLAPLVCHLLLARGMGTAAEVNAFLSEQEAFDDPITLAGMEAAANRIVEAVQNEEKIAVYGDYDCDGITSTALLTTYLQSVGADVFYYIPDRDMEGYGMNRSAVDAIHSMDANLIITVDNGISAHDEIAYAAELGIDVVVTDHHTPRDTLPPAVAVVNPHLEDCPSSFKDYAGVGVAFLLMCVLEEASPLEMLEHCSDLVALGTIADVVPLRGANRAIVRHGLTNLSDAIRPGVAALMEVAGLKAPITAQSVAFGLAPRINAAGRLGRVDDAVQLLMTDDPLWAGEMAEELNALNVQRKSIEDGIMKDIQRKLERMPQLLNRRVLLLSGRGWHHGVVGIVSSRMVERYGKPCILFAVDGDEARGSGRSIEGFSLIEAISACSGRLLRYGGHVLAAGLTLKVEDLASFGDELEQFAAVRYPRMPVPSIPLDCMVSLNLLTIENGRALSLMEPYGAENRPPQFLLQGVTVTGIYPTSENRHLRLRFADGKNEVQAIWFRMSGDRFPYQNGEVVDAVVQIEVGSWNDQPQLSVRISDLRLAGFPEEELLEGRERYLRHRRGEYDEEHPQEDYLPRREELAMVYRSMKKLNGCVTPEYLYQKIQPSISYPRICVALDVFEELELIQRVGDECFRLGEVEKKVELSTSKTLQSLQTASLHMV